jgi:hypothetical protein
VIFLAGETENLAQLIGHGMLNNFVVYGASRVNWAQVKTVNDKFGF